MQFDLLKISNPELLGGTDVIVAFFDVLNVGVPPGSDWRGWAVTDVAGWTVLIDLCCPHGEYLHLAISQQEIFNCPFGPDGLMSYMALKARTLRYQCYHAHVHPVVQGSLDAVWPLLDTMSGWAHPTLHAYGVPTLVLTAECPHGVVHNANLYDIYHPTWHNAPHIAIQGGIVQLSLYCEQFCAASYGPIALGMPGGLLQVKPLHPVVLELSEKANVIAQVAKEGLGPAALALAKAQQLIYYPNPAHAHNHQNTLSSASPHSHQTEFGVAPPTGPGLDTAALYRLFPALNERVPQSNPPCSCVSHRADDIKEMIIHLNDFHRWSREDIADWLDSLKLEGLTLQAASSGN